MPSTTNFGWTTPADTDLVKDGALAIRTLGNGIDTSLLDLKGGTTGQILSKASNTDLDYTWINNDQGDITEVAAGTGITVSGGTGPIATVTNSVATPMTTKGDIPVRRTAGFGVVNGSTNDYVLTVETSNQENYVFANPGENVQVLLGSQIFGYGEIMATFAKVKLSGSTDGKGIKVVQTASTGTTIHATGTSATIIDEVWLYAYNSHSSAVVLTVQNGGTTSPDNDIKVTIPATSGLVLVVPGLILTGTGSVASTVYAYAATANVITITGYVNRIS